jgi:hypothetical protein
MPADAPRPPAGPPVGGLAGQVLAALLNVQDWKRATLLVVLGAAALGGVIVYQARDRVIAGVTAFFQGPPEPELSLTDAQAIADELLTLPDVTMATVWAVNVERNVRTLVVFAADAERRGLTPPRLLDRLRRGYPLLRLQDGVNVPFIHVLNGELWCGAPRPTLEEAHFYESTHLYFLCLQGVPPETGSLVGLIVVGFATSRSAGEVEQLAPQLWHAAERITVRRRD